VDLIGVTWLRGLSIADERGDDPDSLEKCPGAPAAMRAAGNGYFSVIPIDPVNALSPRSPHPQSPLTYP
jgi:hypothetical protein